MSVPTRRLLDSNGVDVVGEVTTSPTSNTILARLKSLLTDIVLKAGTAIIGKVGIDQSTANANEVVIKSGTVTTVSTVTAITGGKIGHDVTGIGHGVMTVTTGGSDLVLAASTACKMVIIQAQTDNTNPVAVGASGVDATIATGTGVLLYPGEIVVLQVDNLADVFVDSITSGEGVRYTYLT